MLTVGQTPPLMLAHQVGRDQGGTMTDDPELVLKFGGSLVEQLGAQLYPSVTATVAELISNAWDADAKNVWISIPFGQSWTETSEIVVIDDGHGMTRALSQQRYLVVGRKRRLEQLANKSEGGRLVHGRKGIGKLAAFGTAGILDCTTRRDGETTNFRLDYDKIRRLDPSVDYRTEPVPGTTPLQDPQGNDLSSGTRIRLTRLKAKRAISRDQFVQSMSRRFALSAQDMRIFINDDGILQRFDVDCEFRYPRDEAPTDVEVDDLGWGHESVNGQPVSWWIGFTEKPLRDDQLQGISILANGKMAQRPFKFDRSQGTEGQLGQEYLVGEVRADWLDEGIDIEDDLIQSNRDQLQVEDPRVEFLLAWGRRRLAWALRTRAHMKRDKAISKFQAGERVKKMLESYTKTEQKRFLNVARQIAKIPEIGHDGLADAMQNVLDAQSERAVREMLEAIESEDDIFQEKIWSLVHEYGLIDARRTLGIVEARLSTIRKLREAVHDGSREVPDIHNMVRADPWLLDPRWNLLDDELDLTDMDVGYAPAFDESGNRLDFLFALAPHSPAPLDEVILVEIKRGSTAKSKEHRANETEVNNFHLYTLAVRAHYAKSTNPPRVRGLMIAQNYTAKADLVRANLESNQAVPLTFRTWDRIIEDTERMHMGWLELSRTRIEE